MSPPSPAALPPAPPGRHRGAWAPEVALSILEEQAERPRLWVGSVAGSAAGAVSRQRGAQEQADVADTAPPALLPVTPDPDPAASVHAVSLPQLARGLGGGQSSRFSLF